MSNQNNISQINHELLFLIACCQVDPSTDDITLIHSHLNKRDINFDDLIKLANLHGVLPLIYHTLKKLPLDSKEPLLQALKTSYLQTVQRNMLMSAELIYLMKLFEKNDISAMAFKGPALSQSAYGDITLRQFGDLDILIRKKDRSRVMDLFMQLGYTPEIDLKKNTKEVFFDSVNVMGFRKNSNRVHIEIHWELLSKNYAIQWDEESLWNTQESCMINQTNIPVINVEQSLLYLCAHGGKHLFERLEWICDIDRSIRAHPQIDWSHLLDEAKKLGIERILFLGLSLSQHFFRSELPQIITQKIAEDKTLPELLQKIIEINFSDISEQGKSYSSFGLLLRMRENLYDKLHFTLKALFYPKFDDFKFIQIPKYFIFLYPFVRPFRLITKYFRS